MFQVIHWFTKNKKYENAETMVLLDSKCCLLLEALLTNEGICESVGDEHDGSLREISAKYLAEFFKWSLKHTTTVWIHSSFSKLFKWREQKTRADYHNIKSLFKRLYSLMHHPSPYKRLGSAITFCHIYRTFREHNSLILQFSLEVIYNAILSLRLGKYDEQCIGRFTWILFSKFILTIFFRKLESDHGSSYPFFEDSHCQEVPSQWCSLTHALKVSWCASLARLDVNFQRYPTSLTGLFRYSSLIELKKKRKKKKKN